MIYSLLNKIDFSGIDWKKMLIIAAVVAVVLTIILTIRYVDKKYLSDTPEDKKAGGKK